MYNKAESFIESIDKHKRDNYIKYWRSITPRSREEYYKRWIFAFCSIRVTWEANSRSYLQVINSKWYNSANPMHSLGHVLGTARTGLYKMRTNGIYNFHNEFWRSPDAFYKANSETWTDLRNRLNSKLVCIGLAKVSFALEMGFPLECEAVCLDTHMQKLYDVPQDGLTNKVYANIEEHWVNTCKINDIPPPIARHIYWDSVQNKDNTRYWSYVFEGD